MLTARLISKDGEEVGFSSHKTVLSSIKDGKSFSIQII